MLPVILFNISAIINTILIEKLLHNLYQKKFFFANQGKILIIMRQLYIRQAKLEKS
jgi:hypothetical protein